TTTAGSAGNGSASRRRSAPLELDGTRGLDRAHVDGPRSGGQRKLLVQPDRQGLLREEPAGGPDESLRQRGSARGRSCHGRTVRPRLEYEPGTFVGTTPDGKLPSAGGPPDAHSQTRKSRDSPTGNPHGPRSSRA